MTTCSDAMVDTPMKAIWLALIDLQTKTRQQHTLQVDENRKVDRVLEELRDSILGEKEFYLKWRRDVEEKCSHVMDKNKELQIEVDALKQMIWKLREKIEVIK